MGVSSDMGERSLSVAEQGTASRCPRRSAYSDHNSARCISGDVEPPNTELYNRPRSARAGMGTSMPWKLRNSGRDGTLGRVLVEEGESYSVRRRKRVGYLAGLCCRWLGLMITI
jgi:hypothetical protein